MSIDHITEVRSFLTHNDHALAVRRILDACLDSGNPDLLLRAIALSESYRAQAIPKDQPLPQQLQEEAATLLSSAENLLATWKHDKQTLLEAKDIAKQYQASQFSLKPISLTIHTGEILGIVGQNGHGKTTLLRCIAGQLALDRGTLLYPQLKDPDYYDIKYHIAFVPQRIPRWYGLLKDNLRFSAAISGITGKENELMVNFMLERLNLSAFANLTWEQISSGYRTRFELARILLQKPRLLILDEPLANLDINAQQTILTDLRYLAKSRHNPMGVILSSQQLHEVEKIADTVMLIRDGECLYNTGKNISGPRTSVLELETNADRDTIASLFDAGIHLQFNGGFYTLSSDTISVQDMIGKLIENKIPVTYFRDITNSTKRFI